MATYYFKDALAPGGSGAGLAQEGLTSDGTAFSPTTGQNFGAASGANRYAPFTVRALTVAGSLSTAVPALDLVPTNAFRVENPITGIIPATAWRLGIGVRANNATYSGRCRYNFRIFASADAAGSAGVRQLLPFSSTATTTANLATTSSSYVTTMLLDFSPGEIRMQGEYLWVVLSANQVTNNGSTGGQQVIWKHGPETRLTVPDAAPFPVVSGGDLVGMVCG